ncbi:MAG: lysophospholipid acyltransferase family protein [Candidatus Limnocylindrales bacterium]
MTTSSAARMTPPSRRATPGAGNPANEAWIDVQAPSRSLRRYQVVRLSMAMISRAYSRVRVEGSERLPVGPAILCFTHQNWADPFYVFAGIPGRPRIYFLGPEQEEMRRGLRNRLMRWGGVTVPFRPGKRGLVAAICRVDALISDGSVVAIAGEGRIHSGEGTVLPLQHGPAYLALRTGVPVVPVAINGTSWLGLRRVVRVRIGMPIAGDEAPSIRPRAEQVARLTAQAQSALEELVVGFPDRPRPGFIGRLLTELFNDWPEGSRPSIQARRADDSLDEAERQ